MIFTFTVDLGKVTINDLVRLRWLLARLEDLAHFQDEVSDRRERIEEFLARQREVVRMVEQQGFNIGGPR